MAALFESNMLIVGHRNHVMTHNWTKSLSIPRINCEFFYNIVKRRRSCGLVDFVQHLEIGFYIQQSFEIIERFSHENIDLVHVTGLFRSSAYEIQLSYKLNNDLTPLDDSGLCEKSQV